MKTVEEIREALEILTETTVWGERILIGPRPGCADALIEALFGLEILRYASGNIQSATLNGEHISNNRASNLQTVDLTSSWHTMDIEYDHKQRPMVDVGDGLDDHPLFKQLHPSDKQVMVNALTWHLVPKVYESLRKEAERNSSVPHPTDRAEVIAAEMAAKEFWG